jgi:hypothetical protein
MNYLEEIKTLYSFFGINELVFFSLLASWELEQQKFVGEAPKSTHCCYCIIGSPVLQFSKSFICTINTACKHFVRQSFYLGDQEV